MFCALIVSEFSPCSQFVLPLEMESATSESSTAGTTTGSATSLVLPAQATASTSRGVAPADSDAPPAVRRSGRATKRGTPEETGASTLSGGSEAGKSAREALGAPKAATKKKAPTKKAATAAAKAAAAARGEATSELMGPELATSQPKGPGAKAAKNRAKPQAAGVERVGETPEADRHPGESLSMRVDFLAELARGWAEFPLFEYDPLLESEMGNYVRELSEAKTSLGPAERKRCDLAIAELYRARQNLLRLKRDAAKEDRADVGVGAKKNGASEDAHVKLRDLEEFDGDALSWPLFYARFNRMVLSRDDIKPSTKLEYLCLCLKPVKSLRVAGYFDPNADPQVALDAALKRLREEYASSQIIKAQLSDEVTGFVALPNEASFEQWKGLREVCETIAIFRDHFDASDLERFRLALELKMPYDDLRDFRKQVDRSFDRLKGFIVERTACAFQTHNERLGRSDMGQGPTKPAWKDSKPQPIGSKGKPAKRLDGGRSHTFLVKGLSGCLFCKKGHKPAECTLPVKRRWSACKRAGVCFRCLSPFSSEHKESCDQVCGKCGGTHHLVLCHKNRPQGGGGGPSNEGGAKARED